MSDVNNDAGWEPIDGAEPPERMDLDDLALIDELTHPIRGTIARRLKEPHTVAELAELLDVPVTRLYHHVNRLEENGLIRVVATRRVGAVTERRYHVTALGFGIDRRLLEDADPEALAKAMSALFDFAKLGMQKYIASGGLSADPDGHSSFLSLGKVSVTPEGRQTLMAALREIAKEHEADEGGEPLALFIAAYPEI